MDIIQAIKNAMDGEATLFLGAGFSIGGINSSGNTIVSGSELSAKLCCAMGIEQSDDLTTTASRYVDDRVYGRGVIELINLLKSELACTETMEMQNSICELPWIRIYTTNYDNVIEVASEKVGRTRNSITATSTRYVPGENLVEAIIHINGYIKGLNESKFEDEFKITDDNYIKDGFLESPWGDLFKTDLERSKAIVFIGYSLDYDQDIKKVLARLGIKDKCVFIDIPTIKDNNAYKLEKYGELYKIGVEGFSNEIQKVKCTYSPHKRILKLQGFKQIQIEEYYTDENFDSRDVTDLLIKGRFERKFINQDGYCVKRKEKIEEVKKILESYKIAILTSKC